MFGMTKCFRLLYSMYSISVPQYSPIYFYNKPILSDCEANIARLAKSAQQSGGGGELPPPCTPMHAKTKFNNYFIYLKYETAAGCRKPFFPSLLLL